MSSENSNRPDRERRTVRPRLISDDDALLAPMTVQPKSELTPFAMAGLAVLALVWVFLDHFRVIESGSTLSALVAFVPFALWVAVVLWRDVPRPFATLVRIGVIYGVMLAIAYQVLWDGVGSGYPPFIGTTVSEMAEPARDLVVRAFAIFTSLLSGVLVGVITGIAAWGIGKFLRPYDLAEH